MSLNSIQSRQDLQYLCRDEGPNLANVPQLGQEGYLHDSCVHHCARVRSGATQLIPGRSFRIYHTSTSIACKECPYYLSNIASRSSGYVCNKRIFNKGQRNSIAFKDRRKQTHAIEMFSKIFDLGKEVVFNSLSNCYFQVFRENFFKDFLVLSKNSRTCKDVSAFLHISQQNFETKNLQTRTNICVCFWSRYSYFFSLKRSLVLSIFLA